MAGTLCKCVSCDRVFWPEPGAAETGACPDCRRAAGGEPEAALPAALPPRRFVALSRVPEGNHPGRRRPVEPREPPLPSTREFSPSQPPLPAAEPTPKKPREEPAPESASEIAPVPVPPPSSVVSVSPTFTLNPPQPLPQMAFNCPACFTLLVIRQTSYDGTPAPCPYCRTTIAPPRIAQASPFTILRPPPGS